MAKIKVGNAIHEALGRNGFLQVEQEPLYTVPAVAQIEIDSLICYNTDGAHTSTVTLYVELSGGTSRVLLSQDLAPGERLQSEGGPLHLNEHDKLKGKATYADEVTWFMSGLLVHTVS